MPYTAIIGRRGSSDGSAARRQRCDLDSDFYNLYYHLIFRIVLGAERATRNVDRILTETGTGPTVNSPAGWTTETVHANGADLQCYRTGEGPSILLVHGFYDDGRRWVPVADRLADDYEVVAYDARGHGQSDAPETGYSLDDRVADLRGVVRELGLDDPVVVGHSMGAATAAWAAARHPDLACGLVLEDPVGLHDEPEIGPDERAEIVRKKVADAASQSVEELVAEHYPEVDADHAERLATASHECSPQIAEIAREGYPAPLSESFPEIECRTLVLRRDAETERRIRDLEAAESLPNGRLVHVPDAGHYVFRDAFDAAFAELQTVLRRI